MTISDTQPPDCKRCGQCCLADVLAYATDEDRQRWEDQGRTDILTALTNRHGIWVGDHFVSAETGRPFHGCTFFTFDGEHFGCAIYGTRPAVCRNYQPGQSGICPQFQGDRRSV